MGHYKTKKPTWNRIQMNPRDFLCWLVGETSKKNLSLPYSILEYTELHVGYMEQSCLNL